MCSDITIQRALDILLSFVTEPDFVVDSRGCLVNPAHVKDVKTIHLIGRDDALGAEMMLEQTIRQTFAVLKKLSLMVRDPNQVIGPEWKERRLELCIYYKQLQGIERLRSCISPYAENLLLDYELGQPYFTNGRTPEGYEGLDVKTMSKVAQTAPTLLISDNEGRVVNIDGKEFLLFRQQIYRMDNKRFIAYGGGALLHIVNRLFCLSKGCWAEAFKEPRAHVTEAIEKGVKMLRLFNPKGDIRGCVQPSYLVTEMTGAKVRGALMKCYTSNANEACAADGIITSIRQDPNSEAYFFDMTHQALSVLAELQKRSMTHFDVKAANVFVVPAEEEEGEYRFFDLHLGDWDTLTPNCTSHFDIQSMGQVLYALITNDLYYFMPSQTEEKIQNLPEDLRDIIRPMLLSPKTVLVQDLLDLLNKRIEQRAMAEDAPAIWKEVYNRARKEVYKRARPW